MNSRMLVAIGLALALVPLLPSGIASHTGAYSVNPVEHDDQGRSYEPDFASTGVLGPNVVNKVIDTNLDGTAVPDTALPPLGGKILAPGCTDNAGRQPSGLCGLYTVGAGWSNGAYLPGVVPPKTVGVQGMSSPNAPGAFTPLQSSTVRFLDSIHQIQLQSVGSTYIDVNHKLDDSGVRAALAGVDPALSGHVLIGPSAVWAWYGKWTDKNGNGVIDALHNDAIPPYAKPVDPSNEFVWMGNCLRFPDIPSPESVARGFCAYDESKLAGGTTVMNSFMFPGNHHAYNGGFDIDPLLCAICQLPSDIPGRQAIHFLGSNGVPVCAENNPAGGFVCGTLNIRNFDQNDEEFFGDPLLGPQSSVAPDGSFHDRSGEGAVNTRQWVHGVGWQTFFYDESILSSMVQVTTVGCTVDSSSANRVDLASCRFADVDEFSALSPAAEDILVGAIKPAARSNWVTVRDAWLPFQTTIDGVTNNKALDTSPVLGPVDDQTRDPGWSREPNAAGDIYPGATRGTCADGDATHNGWCNNYAAHATASHGYGDMQAFRLLYVLRPIGVNNCITCVAGFGTAIAFAGEAPVGSPAPVVRADGDHRRTLGPGQYGFFGLFGEWRDKTQVWDETTLLGPSFPSNGPDGWVGNIVNQTGTFYYRGYADETCTTDKGTGVHTYGECHPYLDGAIGNPQAYGLGSPAHGEWFGRCDSTTNVVLTPSDGVWTVPVFVHRNTLSLVNLADPNGEVAKLQDLTGTTAPISLRAQCGTGDSGGSLNVGDLLILPLGNQGETLTSSVTVDVGSETVRDVDLYVGW